MKLTHLGTMVVIQLSHDLMWKDEHSWSPVTAAVDYSLTGAMLIETATRKAGRPITLTYPSDEMAWHTRALVDQLYAWSEEAGRQFTLELNDGRQFTVVFRHHEGKPIEAKPVKVSTQTSQTMTG